MAVQALAAVQTPENLPNYSTGMKHSYIADKAFTVENPSNNILNLILPHIPNLHNLILKGLVAK